MNKKGSINLDPQYFPKTVGYGKYKEKALIWVAKNDLDFFKHIEKLYLSKYSEPKKKYYQKLYQQYVENNGVSVRGQRRYENKIQLAIELMRKHRTSHQIHQQLLEAGAPHYAIIEIMIDANSVIRREFELEKSFLLDIHLLRYEEIYTENITANLDDIPPGYRRAVSCEYHITAMETLFQKEKMLGIHTKNFKFQINNVAAIQSDVEFDITKLTTGERLEVLRLLNKAKELEILNKPILNTNPLELDITEAVIIEDELETPVRKAKQTDSTPRKEKPTVEGKTLLDIQEAMADSLKEQVKKIFQEKKKQM